MKLQSIKIENYRSIENVNIKIDEIDGGYTYSLIGINESGKTSFLKAISLVSGESVIFPHDFHDDTKSLVISFEYLLTEDELKLLKEKLIEKSFPEDILTKLTIQNIVVKAVFEPNASTTLNKSIEFTIDNESFSDYTLTDNLIVKKEGSQDQEDFNVKQYLEDNLLDFIFGLFHDVIFWRSEPKYLITDPISLDNFVLDPENISIPLKNCFALAGITDIQSEINKMKTSPAEIKNLQEKLEDKVTDHIKKIWPGHPVKIKFQIDNTTLSFLIEDEGVKYKTKTTTQRSDGFRQFISFLLTISAQNSNSQLANTLLLLDEPETHLHPQGQENLRDELIKISRGNLNNIVIFATHSNFMIDKNHLERSCKVFKEGNEKTQISAFDRGNVSYSEVNYLVFEVPTSDYHNELYGFLEAEKKSKLNGLEKNKIWKNAKTNKVDDVSLPTYIRHSIHHPENTNNIQFTQEELVSSIEVLRGLKYGK